MPYKTLLTSQTNGVLEVTLNRPDKYNALTAQVAKEIMAVCKSAARDDSVRCLLLTGAGKGFCAGQDLDEASGREENYSFRNHLIKTYNPMVAAMRNLEKPIIGAINGACAGAGFGLALATDIRYASENAKFLTAFIGLGLAPDSGVSFWLPRLIGLPRATEMLYTNQRVSGTEAAEIGLVNKVFPHDTFLEEARTLATTLAAGPTRGYAMTKRALNKSMGVTFEEQLDYEAYQQDVAGSSADYHEGVTAFKEKRKPNFSGK